VIFFAYIGFDAVSTTGEEAKKPARDLPIAIIGSLLIATILYIAVALTAVGLASQKELEGSAAPLTDALRAGSGIGSWAGDLLSVGAVVAITSVVLTVLYGATRIVFTMARDGLFPGGLAKLNARRVPARLTLGLGGLIAVIAALVPLSAIAQLVSIGTLFAFFVVNLGVIRCAAPSPGSSAASACRSCRSSRGSARRCASTSCPAAAGDLGAVRGMDGDRPARLLPLRPHLLTPAARRGAARGLSRAGLRASRLTGRAGLRGRARAGTSHGRRAPHRAHG